MSISNATVLQNYFDNLKELTANHGGYPYILNYDYQELLPFIRFTINNLGDRYILSNYKIDSRLFEQAVIDFFAALYHCTAPWGYVTSGGTEGNLYGILLARQTYPQAILYASQSSHYSIFKAAWMYRMRYEAIASTAAGEMDYDDLSAKINGKKPVIINLNIGTTFTGAVDNLDHILRILDQKKITNFYIHCDGALGRMLVPYPAENYISFAKGIHSLSISGHKFIGTPFPSGIVLTSKTNALNIKKNNKFINDVARAH